MRRFFLPSLVLILSVLACRLPTWTPEPPVVSDPPVITESPATEPPVLIEPPLPAEGTPSGFMSNTTTGSILFYSPEGVLTGSISIPGPGASFVHAAGGTTSGLPPIIYFDWRDSAQIIKNTAGVETLIISNPEFNRMRGAEGSAWFAYTTVGYADSGIRTQLFVGTAATIAGSAPVIDQTVTDFQGLKPLALRMEGGVPTGVWYTGCMYGIGGDLVFDPCNRVSYIELATGVRSELVGDGYMPSGLSPDHTWVAYARPGGGEPLTILNLVTGEAHTFPAWALNDRGSGDGVFSPDNVYVAWMEGSGYRMDTPFTFRSLVRVGSTSGTVIGDFPADYFSTAAGFAVVWANPVGWLDSDSVLIQVNDESGTRAAVLRLDLPGTAVLLTNGYFSGFTYP